MMNLFERPQPEPLEDGLSTRDEARRVADELELTTHLAGMTAIELRRVLAPRFADIIDEVEHSGGIVSDALVHELAMLRRLLEEARGDVN